MANLNVRQTIAREAARLMHLRIETEYYSAKRKAAKAVGVRVIQPDELPSNAEVRHLVQTMAWLGEAERRSSSIRRSRLAALRVMNHLRQFQPRFVADRPQLEKATLVRVYSDSIVNVANQLEAADVAFEMLEGDGLGQLLLAGPAPFRIDVFPETQRTLSCPNATDGSEPSVLSIRDLEELLLREYGSLEESSEGIRQKQVADCYLRFRQLLIPLEAVKQNPEFHPEGDALFHALQVFERAKEYRPYDEEFLLAALLHDVGKAIEPEDHLAAGLFAIDGLVTDRTKFLIAHLHDARAYREHALTAKMVSFLRESPDFEDLLLLDLCDREGREPGAAVGTVEEALDFIRQLELANEGESPSEATSD